MPWERDGMGPTDYWHVLPFVFVQQLESTKTASWAVPARAGVTVHTITVHTNHEYYVPELQLSWAGRWSVPALWAFGLTGHDQEKAVVCTITIEYCVFLYLRDLQNRMTGFSIWSPRNVDGEEGGLPGVTSQYFVGGKKPLSYCCQPPSSL
jgi:hypothetical protein